MIDYCNTFVIFSAVIIGAVLVFVLYVKRRYTYWPSKGVIQIEPNFLTGNTDLKVPPSQRYADIYKRVKAQGEKYVGVYLFLLPKLVPVDIELIKNIMIKDFDHFIDRRSDAAREADPLSFNLFNMEGDKWRDMRMKLTPTFTSGKMKMMFHTFLECTKGLQEMINESAEAGQPADIKEFLARFTTDIIGSCAFGLECNTMKDPESKFRKYGKQVFQFNIFTRYKFLFIQLAPYFITRYIKMDNSDMERFFINVVKDTMQYRENNDIFRRDFMHLLLQLKNRGMLSEDGKITDEKGGRNSFMSLEDVSAQCFIFFIAGFETSSTTMTFALYELARNQDVQDTLRKEIDEVLAKYNDDITYDAVSEMKYLDLVIKETLRKYPPLGIIPRICTKDYIIPGTGVKIEKGTHLNIPVLGVQMDPEFYPDPEKFDPERFTEENKKKRPACTWMPFGEGPRICIGLRFGMLQSKVGIITILRNFKVSLNSRTGTPLVMSRSFIPSAKDGIWLDVEKIK